MNICCVSTEEQDCIDTYFKGSFKRVFLRDLHKGTKAAVTTESSFQGTGLMRRVINFFHGKDTE